MSNGQPQLSPELNTVAQPNPVPTAVSAERSETPAIEFRNLHRYFGRLKAVNDVSFRAYRGQVMGFIGPNGAGKTTTMRILATLDVPTAGDAFINGYSVIDDPDKVRRILGFMPDSFGKYANMNVLEYIDYFARAYNLSPQGRRDAVERVLVFTELKKLVEKPINALSKGMSQRLGLARTLINDPAVLILDEPAAGLDPRARIELRELVRLLARELKKTVLISSHILTELGEICDSAAIIEAGRILASGTIDEIQQAQRASQGRSIGTAVSVRVLRDVDRVERLLLEQPQASGVTVVAQTATFEFSGDEAELCGLLRLMVREELDVVEFRGRAETLEDAFLAITKGVTQ
jgi:ABC-2 type transport system ATP-binding protein